MIVVDTNVIASLLLPTPNTEDAETLLRADPDWIAPSLWRSEMRSVLALHMRKSLIGFDAALSLQAEAESLLRDREYDVPSPDVLALVRSSACSAYDCEFVALAQSLGVGLVTLDRQIVGAFPDTAAPPADYLASLQSG